MIQVRHNLTRFLLAALLTLPCLSAFSQTAAENNDNSSATEQTKAHAKKHHHSFDKVVQLSRQRDQFTITLPSNRTTGYQWILARFDHNMITPIKQHYQPSNSKMLGAPGNSTWTFKAPASAFTVPMMHKIVLIYARPWNLQPVKRYVVGVIND